MTADEWDQHIRTLPGVQSETNFGYRFYFVDDDHRLPFATMAESDNDWDRVSNLSRPGVFRLNIGVRKETFEQLFAAPPPVPWDYSALDVFLPHPEYAKQHFLCVLNPEGANVDRTRAFLAEAHAVATARRARSGT